MKEVEKGPGKTTREIFEECQKYSPAERREICEDFHSDIIALAKSMANLFEQNSGVLMMHGFRVEVKLFSFNECDYEIHLGSEEFFETVHKIITKAKEQANDERA